MRGLTPEFSAPVPVTVCIIWTRLRHGRLARGSVVCFHDVLLTAVIEGAGDGFFQLIFTRYSCLLSGRHNDTFYTCLGFTRS